APSRTSPRPYTPWLVSMRMMTFLAFVNDVPLSMVTQRISVILRSEGEEGFGALEVTWAMVSSNDILFSSVSVIPPRADFLKYDLRILPVAGSWVSFSPFADRFCCHSLFCRMIS